MKILYLSQRFPYPPNRGDKIPTFNHIKWLSRDHEVHVASLVETAEEESDVATLSQWAKHILVERRSLYTSALGMLRALLLRQPFTLGYFHSAKLKRRIERHVRIQGIDAIVVFSSSMAPYVESLRRQVRVMHFCDVDSWKWSELARKTLAPKRWVYAREANLLLRYERRIASSFASSCVVSSREARLFRRLVPGCAVNVLENGVDCAYFGDVKRRPVPDQVVFVGVMNYPPNVEAVTYFVREVWPRLRALRPGAEFMIVGSHPTREVQQLARTPGVTVTGFVPDVRDYLATASLVVAPLDIARGVQNKILEAMAAGVPVLTTPPGALGLGPIAARHIHLEYRDAGRFARRAASILEHPHDVLPMAAAAQSYVRDHFSWETRGEQLLELIGEAKLLMEAGKAVPVPGAASGKSPNQSVNDAEEAVDVPMPPRGDAAG